MFSAQRRKYLILEANSTLANIMSCPLFNHIVWTMHAGCFQAVTGSWTLLIKTRWSSGSRCNWNQALHNRWQQGVGKDVRNRDATCCLPLKTLAATQVELFTVLLYLYMVTMWWTASIAGLQGESLSYSANGLLNILNPPFHQAVQFSSVQFVTH